MFTNRSRDPHDIFGVHSAGSNSMVIPSSWQALWRLEGFYSILSKTSSRGKRGIFGWRKPKSGKDNSGGILPYFPHLRKGLTFGYLLNRTISDHGNHRWYKESLSILQTFGELLKQREGFRNVSSSRLQFKKVSIM